MLDYLIERENDEMFRTSCRTLAFPDGVTRRVEAYRLVWTWFERSAAYEFGPDADQLLGYALRCAQEEKLEIGQALGRVLDWCVRDVERLGGDFTDDDLETVAARRRAYKCRARNGKQGRHH